VEPLCGFGIEVRRRCQREALIPPSLRWIGVRESDRLSRRSDHPGIHRRESRKPVVRPHSHGGSDLGDHSLLRMTTLDDAGDLVPSRA
jgi:hypothetical protein